MLIEKKEKLGVGDVASLRLTTGDEIIGKVKFIDDTSITISKPIIAQIQMVAPGQAGITFGPYMATVDEALDHRFERAKIVSDPVKTRQDIMAQYIKMTSGIEIVQSAPGLIK